MIEESSLRYSHQIFSPIRGSRFDWHSFTGEVPFGDAIVDFILNSIKRFEQSGDILVRDRGWYEKRLRSNCFALLTTLGADVPNFIGEPDKILPHLAEHTVAFAFLDHYQAPLLIDSKPVDIEMAEICAVGNVATLTGIKRENAKGGGIDAFQAAYQLARHTFPSATIVSWVHEHSFKSLQNAFKDGYNLEIIPDALFREDEYKNPPHVCIAINRQI
ncbi:MAG TPA: hypothetical protein VGT05_01985 [Patescibacteria group bacterium]|nr:hypothetical protein [Patescibacteria group bacterium]